MIFYHLLLEAILYQGKPLDLNNTITNSQYSEKLVCQVLLLQSIVTLVLAGGLVLWVAGDRLATWIYVNSVHLDNIQTQWLLQ